MAFEHRPLEGAEGRRRLLIGLVIAAVAIVLIAVAAVAFDWTLAAPRPSTSPPTRRARSPSEPGPAGHVAALTTLHLAGFLVGAALLPAGEVGRAPRSGRSARHATTQP